MVFFPDDFTNTGTGGTIVHDRGLPATCALTLMTLHNGLMIILSKVNFKYAIYPIYSVYIIVKICKNLNNFIINN